MRRPALALSTPRIVCVFAFLALLLPAGLLVSQTTTPSNSTTSFADVLKNRKHPLHILYVHGIGDDGLDDYDSYYLRRGICETLHCAKSKKDGVIEGDLIFADSGQFHPHATPPAISFLGETVFPVDASGGSELWDASSPFLRRFRLPAAGSPVYVDELNWWPLVFALKCKYVVQPDVTLVGPDQTTLNDCSKKKALYKDTGHYASYPFISLDDAAKLGKAPKQGALVNRKLKGSLLDWGFTDAILSLGPMRPILLDGIQQLVQLAIQPPKGEPAEASESPEFIIVTHSLGSYLIFAALDATGSGNPGSTSDTSYLLAHTSRVYFFANQLRLLEMANLDVTKNSNLSQHLAGWVTARSKYLTSSGENANENPPQIIAWNDASDLLTWEVPPLCGIIVENHTVRNTFNWFGLAEGPTKAHDYYGLNRKVINDVLNSNTQAKPQPCPAANPSLSAANTP